MRFTFTVLRKKFVQRKGRRTYTQYKMHHKIIYHYVIICKSVELTQRG